MPTLQELFDTCSAQIPTCYQHKALVVDNELAAGTPFSLLGGQRIRQCRAIVRFKIGRDWRLVYLEKDGALEPLCMISRQQFEQLLKRRHKHH